MNRVEREITAPIKIDELQQLLNTMTPEQEQAITTRTRISEVRTAQGGVTAEPVQPAKVEPVVAIEPEIPRLFNGVDWDRFLNETVSKMVTPRPPRPMPPPIPRALSESSRPKRKYARPFSQVAALLPQREQVRSPGGGRPAPWTRAKTQTCLAVVEPKAPRTVAELRARLDSGETHALWAASSSLSPQVLAHLSAEEIAMLPAEIRGELPGVLGAETPPPLEEPCVPVTVVEIQTAKIRRFPVVNRPPQRSATILASLASALLLGICAIYFLS